MKTSEKKKAGDKKHRERTAKYKKEHPEWVEKVRREQVRKGGKYYDTMLKYNRTGLRGERSKVRYKHGYKWRQYKKIIAPGSHLHHEWIPGTADYRGVALVEADQHMHGIVDVIEILEGEVALLTEEEVRRGTITW